MATTEYFPKTEVPQVNPTPAEQSALAALAARSAGVIPRKKSDGTYEDGPMDFTVANDFDPVVSGRAAPLRSTMVTLDASKAWVKRGSGDTDWWRIDKACGSFTAPAGGPYSAIDADFLVGGVPVTAGLTTVINGFSRVIGAVTGGDQLFLRINDAKATGISRIEGGNLAFIGLGSVSWDSNTRCEFRIGPSIASKRQFSAFYASSKGSASCGFVSGLLDSTTISSVGVGSSDAYLAAASQIKLCTDETGRL